MNLALPPDRKLNYLIVKTLFTIVCAIYPDRKEVMFLPFLFVSGKLSKPYLYVIFVLKLWEHLLPVPIADTSLSWRMHLLQTLRKK